MIPLRLPLPPAALLAVTIILGAAQNQPPAATVPATRPAGLPEAWFGAWRGTAQIVLPGGEAGGQFEMGLDIAPADDQPAGTDPVYDWAITYTQGQNTQTRPYLLRIARDEEGRILPGHFVLDERNGIFVDQFLIDQAIQGHFIVISGERRQILHARYELIEHEAKPAIEVEIATYDGNESRRSVLGQTGAVESRRLVRLQRGILVRQ